MFVVICLQAQVKVDKTNQVFLYSINTGKDFISLEYFSMDKTPFSKLEVLRSDGQEAERMGFSTQRYNKKDTAIYIYTDTKIKPDAVYQYSVVPIKADGSKGQTTVPIFASTKLFANNYFKQAVAQRNDKVLGIDVKWALSSTEYMKSVEVFRAESSEGQFDLLTTTPSTQTLYTDLTVKPDKVYFYKLRAQNFITSQTIESAAFFDVGMPTSKPNAPVIQSVAQTSKGVEVKVGVNEPHLAGVRIYRKKDGEEKFEQASVAVSCDSFVVIIDSAMRDGAYTYSAKAENASRLESDFSNAVSINVVSSVVEEFAGSFDALYDNTTVKLFWQSNAKRHKVKRNELGGGSIMLNNGAEFFGNRYIDTTILPGKQYEYVLYAIGDNGQSSNGILAIVETPKDELLNNQLLRGYAMSQSVVLEWGALADERVTKQKLYRTIGAGVATMVATIENAQLEYIDKTVKLGEIYRYYLVSVDAKGNESEPGNEIVIRVQ